MSNGDMISEGAPDVPKPIYVKYGIWTDILPGISVFQVSRKVAVVWIDPTEETAYLDKDVVWKVR